MPVNDLPSDFRVAFLDKRRNTKNIYRSKSVGEPPQAQNTDVRKSGNSIPAGIRGRGEDCMRLIGLVRSSSAVKVSNRY